MVLTFLISCYVTAATEKVEETGWKQEGMQKKGREKEFQ